MNPKASAIGARLSRAIPPGVIVIHLTADKPGGYTGRIWLSDMHSASGDRLERPLDRQPGSFPDGGLKYESQLKVLNTGGTVRVETGPLPAAESPLAGVPGAEALSLPGAYLAFENCTSLTLILAADTDYLPDHQKNWRGEDPHREITARVDAASGQPVPALLAEHIADYRRSTSALRWSWERRRPPSRLYRPIGGWLPIRSSGPRIPISKS